MQNMETLSLRTTPFVVTPTARPGSGGSMEKTEEAKAGGNAPDMPTSAKSGMAREYVEPPQAGKSK